MAASAKNSMRQRWDDCEVIASHLTGVTKGQVYDFLYKEIVAAGKLEQALRGDKEFVDWIMTEMCWQRMREPPKVKVHQPRKGNQDMPETPTEKLKVAMWYIGKFETPEESKIAFDAALAAITEMRK